MRLVPAHLLTFCTGAVLMCHVHIGYTPSRQFDCLSVLVGGDGGGGANFDDDWNQRLYERR